MKRLRHPRPAGARLPGHRPRRRWRSAWCWRSTVYARQDLRRRASAPTSSTSRPRSPTSSRDVRLLQGRGRPAGATRRGSRRLSRSLTCAGQAPVSRQAGGRPPGRRCRAGRAGAGSARPRAPRRDAVGGAIGPAVLAARPLAHRRRLVGRARLRARPRLGQGGGRHAPAHLLRAGAVRRRLRDAGAGRDPGGAVLALRPRRRADGAGARRPRRPHRPQRPAPGARSAALRPLRRSARDGATRTRSARALLAAVPATAAGPSSTASLAGDRRQYRDRRADARAAGPASHDLGLPGVSLRGGERARLSARRAGRPRDRLRRPRTASAWPAPSGRSTSASAPTPARAPVALSIDLRVQGALRGRARQGRQTLPGAVDAVGIVVNVRTGEILGHGELPELRSQRRRQVAGRQP